MSSLVENAMCRATWQETLFSEIPNRLELSKLKATWPLTDITIRIHRNHSFEHVASATHAWFAWWERRPTFIYSDYDDSLYFDLDASDNVEVEIIWLDLTRYTERFADNSELIDWLESRLRALRNKTNTPILLLPCDGRQDLIEDLINRDWSIVGIRVGDFGRIQKTLGKRFYDERASKFSGTRLSNAACLLVARELACRWIPALVKVRCKAVIVDLDQTLYNGVVGEDGHNVILSPTHKAFQEDLFDFRKQGVFLALVSRNEEDDVRALFKSRQDFPLQWQHFSATKVNWERKSENIRQVARQLRISVDSVVFIDDNPGELAEVAMESPKVSLIHAGLDPEITRTTMAYLPGLWAWSTSAEDEFRIGDMNAEIERAHLVAFSEDPIDYLRSLKIKLLVNTKPENHASRLSELSLKTNQFNLNFERIDEIRLSKMIRADEYRIAAISMADRLSDSGIIGLIIGKLTGNILLIEELAISCRALGRKLETLMITSAVRALIGMDVVTEIRFSYKTGPRNAPALEWLTNFTKEPLVSEGQACSGEFDLDYLTATLPVDVKIQVNDIPYTNDKN